MKFKYPNPFTPRFGSVPPHLAGRDHLLSSYSVAFVGGGNDPLLSAVFSGARGSGKTALLVSLCELAEERGWVAAKVAAIPGLLEDVLQQAISRGAHLLSSEGPHLTGMTVGPVGASWEQGSSMAPNWRTRMSRVLDELATHDAGLVIAVDEVKATDEMVQLASIVQHFVGEGRKVALLMAGLPHDVSALLSHEDVSFLRRASSFRLGNVTPAEARVALRRTIEDYDRTIGPEALELAAEASGGYPYLLQLIGFRAWALDASVEEITLADVRDAIELAYDEYERGVLFSTYRDLSAGDIRFLEAMLEDEGPSATTDIAARMGVRSNYASKYKQRLLEQGVIEECGRGAVQVALPRLKDYVRGMARDQGRSKADE